MGNTVSFDTPIKYHNGLTDKVMYRQYAGPDNVGKRWTRVP